ncbi:MAG: L,D-transpeptidase family protein [Lachnospiraceae bacterium]
MNRKKILITAGIVILALLGVYLGVSFYFQSHFLPNTTVNGIESSRKTAEEVKNIIRRQASDYTLTLELREGKSEQINGEQIGLKPVFNGSIEGMLKKQNEYAWISALFHKTELESRTTVSYDKEKMKKTVKSLTCMGKGQTAPQDAFISEYNEKNGYKIMPEVQGNKIKRKRLLKVIDEAVLGLQEQISLEKEKCYQRPKLTEGDQNLQRTCQTLNTYTSASITYTFGEETETLKGDTIHQWLQVEDDYSVTVRDDLLSQFVKELASNHNTVFHPKTLKTAYGTTVTITNGDYGWWIDTEGERAQLLSDIQEGKTVTREPVYKQRAASFGVNDYGDTYVEINLTAQHLYFYKNGVLVTESDFVSGNVSKNYDTPTGAYSLTYKERNATLGGRPGFDYSTKVAYWMPFCNNVGMHDADWRDSFGGNIYKTNGSHGCINLPPWAAEKIFNSIEEGDPVLVYELGGKTEEESSESETDISGQESTEMGSDTETETTTQSDVEDEQVELGPPADD